MKTLMLVILVVLQLQGCATSSHVYSIGQDSYMVESYYDPRSLADKNAAFVRMDRRSEDACKGQYNKTKEYVTPDPYWGDFVVYWEITCPIIHRTLL